MLNSHKDASVVLEIQILLREGRRQSTIPNESSYSISNDNLLILYCKLLYSYFLQNHEFEV